MSSEGLRVQALRALERLSHSKKPSGTSVLEEFQGHDPAVPLSPPLGQGQWDSAVEGAEIANGTPVGQRGTVVPIDPRDPGPLPDLLRRCDHCGRLGRSTEPLNRWDWPGRPDGIWLHPGCEAPWHDRKGAA
jgi:hypothetical protein